MGIFCRRLRFFSLTGISRALDALTRRNLSYIRDLIEHLDERLEGLVTGRLDLVQGRVVGHGRLADVEMLTRPGYWGAVAAGPGPQGAGT